VAPAAQAVETTLVKVLPVALSFLAKWLGLDGISDAIRDGLKKVQAPVEKAVGKVLDVVTEKAKAVWGAVKGGAGKVVDQGQQVATAVGNKVKGWLGLRQKFVVGTEQHTLFFSEKGEIMVASTPQPYLDFLKSIQPKLPSASPALRDKYATAVTLAAEIKLLEAGNPAAPTLTDTIRNKVKGLAFLTSELMQLESTGSPIAADSQAVYAGVNGTDFGLGMHMHYLSYSTVKGGLSRPSGSRPYPYGFNPKYDILNQRRTPGSTDTLYVRGHLLSEKLNGPGEKLENIVPLSRTGNTKHEKEVEYTLKDAAGAVPQRQNRAFSYSVVPRYGRTSDPNGLKLEAQQLATNSDPGVVAKANAWVRVLDLETDVPISLVCTFREIHPVSRQPVKDGLYRFHEVDNPVDQNRASYLKTLGIPQAASDFNIAGKHPQVNINRPNKQALIDLGFNPVDVNELLKQGRIFTSVQELLNFSPVVDKAAWQALVRAKRKSNELKKP
jgi:hypothetical protein